jgi:hypothetical protein
MIRWTIENPAAPPPPPLARMARLTMLAAQVNFVLSFPMLFFMAAASHYPIFGGMAR